MKTKLRFPRLIMVATLLLAGPSHSADIVVYALFQGKAVLLIDGQRRLLSVGQTSPEGITLVATDGQAAELTIGGRREVLPLGAHVGQPIAGPATTRVQLWPDEMGMYVTTGSINGHLVRLMVDTGATQLAMNTALAKRLGIDFRVTGTKGRVETASGVVAAYGVVLRSVKVGDIELRDVEAVVIDGDYPSEALLGMSFLGRVDLERTGKSLVLQQKH
jgi:aspartyl protease family protein